jgi:hypothetical protein
MRSPGAGAARAPGRGTPRRNGEDGDGDERFRNDCAFTTWAYRIAIRPRSTISRRRKIGARTGANVGADGADSDTVDEMMGQDLWRVVRALPNQQRDAVLPSVAGPFAWRGGGAHGLFGEDRVVASA